MNEGMPENGSAGREESGLPLLGAVAQAPSVGGALSAAG